MPLAELIAEVLLANPNEDFSLFYYSGSVEPTVPWEAVSYAQSGILWEAVSYAQSGMTYSAEGLTPEEAVSNLLMLLREAV